MICDQWRFWKAASYYAVVVVDSCSRPMCKHSKNIKYLIWVAHQSNFFNICSPVVFYGQQLHTAQPASKCFEYSTHLNRTWPGDVCRKGAKRCSVILCTYMYVCMYIFISGIKPIEHHTQTHSRNRTKLLTTWKEQNSTHKHKYQIEQNYPEKNRATDDYQ